MQFDSIAEFLAMGKHGVFVWSCYVVFVGVVAINSVLPMLRRKHLMRRLQRAEKRHAGSKGPRPMGL